MRLLYRLPLFLLLILPLSSCSGGGPADADAKTSFALTVSDLVNGKNGYFKKPYLRTPGEDSPDSFVWDHSGLMTLVFADEVDSPIQQVNCAYLYGEASTLGGIVGVMGITKMLNQGKELLRLEDLGELVGGGPGSTFPAGEANLLLKDIQEVNEGEKMIIIHITPSQ